MFFIADQSMNRATTLFSSVRDLVLTFSDIFKTPYQKTTNEVNDKLRSKIATEILETEKSYVKSLTTIERVKCSQSRDEFTPF